jgi:hypothetical protein
MHGSNSMVDDPNFDVSRRCPRMAHSLGLTDGPACPAALECRHGRFRLE